MYVESLFCSRLYTGIMSGEVVALQPRLPEAAEPVLTRFHIGLQTCRLQSARVQALLEESAADPSLAEMSTVDQLTVRLFFEVLRDFVDQGWRFSYQEGRLLASPPDSANGSGTEQREVKRRIRSSLVAARNEQLREASVRRFVMDMERPRRYRGREVSVLDLFVSPRALAEDLQRRLDAPREIREELLGNAIRPYIQYASEGRDEFTNLRLIDIWRYCRYTWSLPFNSQPGRKMFYLVRDGAREFHPVIGIGALGSSVVHIGCRDRDIGWTRESLAEEPDKGQRILALRAEIDRTIGEVFSEDLLSEEELECPTAETLERLSAVFLGSTPINKRTEVGRSEALMQGTLSSLYRRKRAKELYGLLRARMTFESAAQEVADDAERMRWMLGKEDGRQTLGVALRSVKKRHVGSSLMDITTCGALPPYSELLGGKLVALLMCSPQIISDYRERYGKASSEIASRMKGEKVIRPADLVVLGTTSLYHTGSSQYNRLRAPVAKGELRYRPVGKTRGFGSVHLSRRTYRTLQELLEHHPNLLPESSAFAAGVNYKLRTIETGLKYLGLSRLLRHESPRLVYLVPLAKNWRGYLTGMEEIPEYFYEDLGSPEAETNNLVEYWKERWFKPRAKRLESLRRLQGEGKKLRVSSFLEDSQTLYAEQPALWQHAQVSVGGQGEGKINLQRKLSWDALAELKDSRTSFAERLTNEELEALHVPTRLDEKIVGLVERGCRVYLSGNPGDGKTHIIRKHLADLDALGAFVHLDASAEREDLLVEELRSAIAEGRPSLVAVNEGPLRRMLPQLPDDERRQLRAQLDNPYLYGTEAEEDYQAVVVNLGSRQVMHNSLLEGMLRLVSEHVDYEEAPASVKRNRDMLAKPRVRERLLLLLQMVARSGAHVTMNQALGFFSYIVTGGEKDPEKASRIAPYYDLCFDKANPLNRWLAEIDPVHLSHPMVDMCLWERDGSIEWLETPELPSPEGIEDPERAYVAFHALKRRYFFEASDGGELLNMIPEDRKTFLELLENASGARDTAKRELLEALAYFFGGSVSDGSGSSIRVWTSLRYEAIAPPTAFVSSQEIPGERASLLLPRLRDSVAPLLEYDPSHVRLSVRPVEGREPVSIDIDLELWMALMRLKRGMPQRNHDPVVGRKLSQFMSRLAAENRGRHGGFVEVWVRDVELAETMRVKVSLERNRYEW